MRIVIEFDAADGRATVTTEPQLQAEGMQPATATDAGPPADGAPLTGQAPAAVGMAVDAGQAPDAVGAGAVADSEGTDAGAADGEHA